MSETPGVLEHEDTFYFGCHPGIDCFTQCCQDVNILLTPYDIVQMKNRIGISSTEFLKQYTKTLIAPETAMPAVQFKMDEANDKRCYFVGDQGCGVYEHRPWSCRMYPLDHSSEGAGFAPMVDSSRCLGLNDNKAWRLQDWFEAQGLKPYNDWNKRFAALAEDPKLTTWRTEHPGAMEIFHLACYDIDRFREVVFKENLYEMLGRDPIDLEELRTDDFAMLDFAFVWLKSVADR